MYTVSEKDVWLVSDYPDQIYNNLGQRVGEIARARQDGPNSLLNSLPADEIDKMLPRTRAQERDCPKEILELVNEAKFIEMQTLHRKGCYSELMPLPPGKKALRHVWALRAKADANGMTSKIKARCALDGSRDKHEVPKWDAYSPVVNATTMRVLVATHINDPEARFWQIDIVCAYLAAPMKREVYAYPPDGFRKPETAHLVHKVLRALYGGADSGRCYYETWNQVHLDMGFQPVHHDSCYLQIGGEGNSYIRFCYHVDDGVYAQRGQALWQWYLKKLCEAFEIKVQPLDFCLGIQFHIDYDAGIVHMEQSGAIEKMLRDFGLDGEQTKSVKTPVLRGYVPTIEDATEHPASEQAAGNLKCFRMLAALGSLNYIHCGTRPDIGKPLRLASKFGTKFGDNHVMYVKHIMRYLKGTKYLGLTYRRAIPQSPGIQIFTDASHASDIDTRRSVSGIVVKHAGNTVFWKVCFQSIVSHSSSESELMALDKGATIGQYIKWLTVSMGVKHSPPIRIFVDNAACIDMTRSPVQPGRNLHVHARFFYVRDFVRDGEYEIRHLRTDRQLSDVLVTHKSDHTFLRLRSYLLGNAHVFFGSDGEAQWHEGNL